VSGNSISWAIYKSAPRSRQINMPAPHHSVFYRPDALPAAQATASKHWRHGSYTIAIQYNTMKSEQLVKPVKQNSPYIDCALNNQYTALLSICQKKLYRHVCYRVHILILHFSPLSMWNTATLTKQLNVFVNQCANVRRSLYERRRTHPRLSMPLLRTVNCLFSAVQSRWVVTWTSLNNKTRMPVIAAWPCRVPKLVRANGDFVHFWSAEQQAGRCAGLRGWQGMTSY